MKIFNLSAQLSFATDGDESGENSLQKKIKQIKGW